MLRGAHVLLRPVLRDDVAQLHAWSAGHDEWALTSDRPYVPSTAEDALKGYDAGERWRATDDKVPWAVEADGGLAGYVTLWGIDSFNRKAHLGIALAPHARGRGWGSDTCRVLLRYAFRDRGLHRVQLEVLATNTAAQRAYLAAGFVVEGTYRQSGWVDGAFVDEVVMAALATDLTPDPAGTSQVDA